MRAIQKAGELVSIPVLVISPSQENRADLHNVLVASGLRPIVCSSLSEGRQFLEGGHIQLVFFDGCLPDQDLQSLVEEAGKRPKPLPVIAISRTGEWDECLAALRAGAFDYMALPPQREEVDRILKFALGENFQRNGHVVIGAAS